MAQDAQGEEVQAGTLCSSRSVAAVSPAGGGSVSDGVSCARVEAGQRSAEATGVRRNQSSEAGAVRSAGRSTEVGTPSRAGGASGCATPLPLSGAAGAVATVGSPFAAVNRRPHEVQNRAPLRTDAPQNGQRSI
jgi:hypothetical protein